MDLRVFYQKVRDIEATIPEACPVVESLATPDGGRAGTLTEAPRALAARMIAQGQARLASEEQARSFRTAQAEARRVAEQAAAASRLQLTVLSTTELSRLKNPGKATKDQG